jgi:hypothetical protein
VNTLILTEAGGSQGLGFAIPSAIVASAYPQLRKYGHDGNYLRTLYPWDPDQLDRIVIPKRTLPDAKVWHDTAPPAGSRQVPVTVMGSHASMLPFQSDSGF